MPLTFLRLVRVSPAGMPAGGWPAAAVGARGAALSGKAWPGGPPGPRDPADGGHALPWGGMGPRLPEGGRGRGDLGAPRGAEPVAGGWGGGRGRRPEVFRRRGGEGHRQTTHVVEHVSHPDVARGRRTQLVVVDVPHEFGEPPGRRCEIDHRSHGYQLAMPAARPPYSRRRLPTTIPVRRGGLPSGSSGTGRRYQGQPGLRPRSGATAPPAG